MVFPHSYRTEHSETVTANGSYGEYFLGSENKVKIQPTLLKVIQSIDFLRLTSQDNLAKMIQIKSITSDIRYRDEVKKMIKFMENWLEKLEFKFEVFNIGYYYVRKEKIRLPPVILATLGNDPNKKTVCAYSHLDVPDPKQQDNWDTDPWTLTAKDNYFYGNGVGCGKGSLSCWLNVIEAFKHSKMNLPVNIKLCIEMMNHQNSEGFGAFVSTKKQDFFNKVDFVAQVNGEWMGPKAPCVIYGTVGVLQMEITLEGDSIENLKKDLKTILDTVANERLEILIPHYNDMVHQIGPDEERLYENIREFNPEEIRESLPPHKRDWGKVRLLMNFWRLPSVFFDEVEECKCPNRDKKMIRNRFILKIVPRQTVDFTLEIVQKHVTKVIKDKNIKSKVNVKCVSSTRPWVEDQNSVNYQCVKTATMQIYKEEPSMIREDKGLDTAAIFNTVLEKNLVIIPICSKGSNLGKANEHISTRCYFEGTKLIAAYMFQLAIQSKKKRKDAEKLKK